MNSKSIIRLTLVLTLLFSCLNANAQPPRGPQVASPQIHSDRTVTFRYLSPFSNEVKLSAQFEKAPVSMIKGGSGIWSVTVGPVKSDIYPYNFVVDGTSVMDPANEYFFPNERFKASLVEIPADTALIHSLKKVPHGTVTYEYYPSAERTTGSLVVYTPPGYSKNLKKRYPVYYLISGTTDTEETFFKVGKINLILDNLIANGQAKPMIVVMPYGNVEATIAAQNGGPKPGDPSSREGADAVLRAKSFENDLMSNIIPHVEANYRAIGNSQNRAIGGFSRGGGQTLRAAFGNMDAFSYVCCYSAYLSKKEIEANFSPLITDPNRTNRLFKLFWVGVGNEDFLYNQTVEFMDFLKTKGIKSKGMVTSGGHTWMNVKTYLAATAPLLFK